MDKTRKANPLLATHHPFPVRSTVIGILLLGYAFLTIAWLNQRSFLHTEQTRMHNLEAAYRMRLEQLGSLEHPPELENDKTLEENPPFLLLNRAAHTVKGSMLELLKLYELEELGQRISDEQFEYNPTQQLVQGKPAPNPKKIPTLNRKVSTYSHHTPTSKKIVRTEHRQPTPQLRAHRFFIWPLERKLFWLSSPFGARRKPNGKPGFHYGIDLAALRGTPIQAAAEGIVEQAQYTSGYGNMILINHPSSPYKTKYAHLNTIKIKRGQWVRKGQQIGTVGDTGFTIKAGRDASHLHFEVLKHAKPVDPVPLLS